MFAEVALEPDQLLRPSGRLREARVLCQFHTVRFRFGNTQKSFAFPKTLRPTCRPKWCLTFKAGGIFLLLCPKTITLFQIPLFIVHLIMVQFRFILVTFSALITDICTGKRILRTEECCCSSGAASLLPKNMVPI